MKFGVCSSPDKERIGKLVAYGAEYIELNGSAVYGLSDGDFEALKTRVAAGEFVTYSCNGLCPGDLRLTGDVDFGKVRGYAEKAFERLSELGIKLLVFGSGKAKQVPDGFPVTKAWEQLYEVGRIFSEEAAKNGQTVAVEGLRREEVNIVNTLDDVYRYVKAVGADNFRINADFFHMDKNGEPLSKINEYKDEIVHVHVCGRNRGVPSEDDADFIRACISKLKETGYSGNVSFEGKLPPDLSGVEEMLGSFKRLARE